MEEIIIAHEGLEVVLYLDGETLREAGMFPSRIAAKVRALASTTEKLASLVETEMHCTGEDLDEHHGVRLVGGNPGKRLLFKGMTETKKAKNRVVTLNYTDPVLGLEVKSNYELITGQPVIRKWVGVKNSGKEAVGLEHVFSAVVQGIGLGGAKDWSEKLKLHIPYSHWCQEGQWQSGPVGSFGLHRHSPSDYGMSGISVSQTSSFSSVGYLPMGLLEDLELGMTWFWQIEHNGSWHWEIGRANQGALYLAVGGPEEEHSHWWKNLKPGETFETVPVAVGVTEGDYQEAIQCLTGHRRTSCLKPHWDNTDLPVIFNDYMNCLAADPTTEKELPLIEAAAKVGCEIFMIDAGWYADPGEDWWPTVGVWQPNNERFPNGFKEITDSIHAHGMIPGMWFEIEVVGVKGPMKDKPDSWFMMRHGKRVIDSGRYILDFRNPEVIAHADEVVDRLVRDFGVGYIKNDYNVTARMGTETDADSFGDGLLQHCRAFLDWLDTMAQRHPKLIMENCASGGSRMDYATLSRCQIQSSSDQTDYRYYPPIVSGCMAASLPEQLAVWSYPLVDATEEAVAFNMINSLLCRIHLSGRVADLPAEKQKYVTQAIELYKGYRKEIPEMVPFWPTGMFTMGDRAKWASLGMKHETKPEALLAVWRFEGSDTPDSFAIPLPEFAGKQVKVEQIYPADLPCSFGFEQTSSTLSVGLETPWSARLFKLTWVA